MFTDVSPDKSLTALQVLHVRLSYVTVVRDKEVLPSGDEFAW
jgi:hypothetical protein